MKKTTFLLSLSLLMILSCTKEPLKHETTIIITHPRQVTTSKTIIRIPKQSTYKVVNGTAVLVPPKPQEVKGN